MDQGYHYEDPSVRSNHNENILLLKEVDLGYPQVADGGFMKNYLTIL